MNKTFRTKNAQQINGITAAATTEQQPKSGYDDDKCNAE